ncbi:MAG: nucleoside 2-deoxyribosyltransferase [Liquorilactobacillus hordei]|uniref:nucleoside 2-deoxyribosyltransferase n=1 Tax=Liquorilactobacillus hordei TaxID=468911 RepID=UPI0039ED667A
MKNVKYTNVKGIVLTPQKTYYHGAGWFTPKQEKAYDEFSKALEANVTLNSEHSYVPLEHQYKNIRVDEHPEYLHDKEWAIATFNGDLVGIKTSDIAMFCYLPTEEDIGCGMEIGYAKALGKYVVLVIPDEEYGKPINLMSFGGADLVLKMSKLADFDFNKPEFNFYNGAVY